MRNRYPKITKMFYLLDKDKELMPVETWPLIINHDFIEDSLDQLTEEEFNNYVNRTLIQSASIENRYDLQEVSIFIFELLKNKYVKDYYYK